ncbi:MAG: Holliday junction resolvase RuvX [Burkholderiaceae bacterium]|nr:Holliday junction resolvase RuvX [Burkholderiaceae bacterium]
MGLDYGTRRTGVATGNRMTRTATPRTTVQAEGQARWAHIERLLNEWQPDALVVGVPFHPDGAAHGNTEKARRFSRQLQGRYRLPVFEVDERYSTTEALAASGMRDVDARAACIILEQFLRSLP